MRNSTRAVNQARIVLGQPWGTNPAPDWTIWLISLFIGLGLPLFLHALKLVVEVDRQGVLIHYVPVLSCAIPFEEVKRHAVRTYGPIREYGSWGVHWAGRKRRVTNSYYLGMWRKNWRSLPYSHHSEKHNRTMRKGEAS
jgi:hypothetical protein